MKILALGEVLWDRIKGKMYIGGAPFNSAAYCKKLGADSYLFTAIGDDSLGKKILNIFKEKEIKTNFVKIISKPTCVVGVFFDEDGSPQYNFPESVSWDYIKICESDINFINKLNFDYFYFGSLAQRKDITFNSFKVLLDRCKFKKVFFDLNLRFPYYSKDKIKYSLSKCNILKVNDDEAKTICKMFKFRTNDYKELTSVLLKKFNIEIMCITLGGKGAYISNKKEFIYCQSYKTIVRDTVGSGDAFTAALMTKLYEGLSIKDSCDFANRIGALVASMNGAIPEYNIKELP